MRLRRFWQSDEAFARRLQEEEDADAGHGGFPDQVLIDERLARLLQEQSPITESHQTEVSDEELARRLQALLSEEDGERDESRERSFRRSRNFHRSGEADWRRSVSAMLLSGGTWMGCISGLQLAQCFSCGQAVQWICSIGGGVIGYFATFEDAHRWRRQDSHSDSDDDDPFMQGVDLEDIEGHTVGHTFHGATNAEAPGNPEHLKCMVCMEEFADGETLRSLPCLHRYHQNCIDQWLVRCATCPICKQNITAPQNLSSQSVVENASTNGFARLFRRRAWS